MNIYWLAFGGVFLFLAILLLLPILQGKSQPGTPSRNSWSLPSIPTWAWWTVGVVVGALALYFLVPWQSVSSTALPTTSSTEIQKAVGGLGISWGILIAIVITIGLIVLRYRGFGGGVVTTAIVVLSIFIGVWFLLGERAPVASAQLRAKTVSILLDDKDDSEDVNRSMTKVEWPSNAYDPDDLTIKPMMWSNTLWFKPNCGVQHSKRYGSLYIAEHLNQEGQERKWVIPQYGQPDHEVTVGMRFMILVPGQKILKVYNPCEKKAWSK